MIENATEYGFDGIKFKENPATVSTFPSQKERKRITELSKAAGIEAVLPQYAACMKKSNEVRKMGGSPVKKARDYISKMENPSVFNDTGLTRSCYLDMMEKAIGAYSKAALEQQADEFLTNGVDDVQTCSRITNTIGILLADGRLCGYEALWIKLMDACCREVANTTSGCLVDFAVKELVLSYKAMSAKAPAHKKKQWLADLGKIEPYKTYDFVSTKRDRIHNINIYNMAGEYLRETQGLTQTDAYYATHWPIQFHYFDENGMYIDPNAPMLYDITTRVQIQLITGFGYRGEFFDRLDRDLEHAGYMTLLMQSSNFMLPYGGRSNQYLFNEALIAANCEYEAARHKKLGDLKTAGVYKRSAHLAVLSIKRWLDETPPQHIKNFYPIESKFGTEDYGFYNKYMVTFAAFIYIAYLFADDTIGERPCPAELGGYVAQTSEAFHKIFANCAGHSIEIDTKAHQSYDATGLGRYHKAGVPAELGLSTPFAAKPEYFLPKGMHTANLSICPGWDNGLGGIQYLSDLSEGLAHEVTVIEESKERVKFSIAYTGACLTGCDGVTETYTLDKDGVKIEARLLNPGSKKIYYQVPLFASNGKDESAIAFVENGAIVTMGQYVYQVNSDGSLTVDDTRYANRNGAYALAKLQKSDSLISVKLTLAETESKRG